MHFTRQLLKIISDNLDNVVMAGSRVFCGHFAIVLLQITNVTGAVAHLHLDFLWLVHAADLVDLVLGIDEVFFDLISVDLGVNGGDCVIVQDVQDEG